jgi:hypothetical protein
MPKALSIMGMLVAALILLIFVLDLVLSVPFGGSKAGGMPMHIGMIIAGGVLFYLGYASYREQA